MRGDLEDAVEAAARAAVLAQPWLSLQACDRVLDPTTPGAALRAVVAGELVAEVDAEHVVHVPSFQVDVEAGRVRRLVAEVNVTLGAAQDPWGVGSWWLSPCGWLPDGTTR